MKYKSQYSVLGRCINKKCLWLWQQKLEVNELKSGVFPYRLVLISVDKGTHMIQWLCCWLVDRGTLLGFPGGPRNFYLEDPNLLTCRVASGSIKIFIFSKNSTPALRPIQPPTEWVSGTLSGIKQAKSEANDSALYISNIKNENSTPSKYGAKFSTVMNSAFTYCYKRNG